MESGGESEWRRTESVTFTGAELSAAERPGLTPPPPQRRGKGVVQWLCRGVSACAVRASGVGWGLCVRCLSPGLHAKRTVWLPLSEPGNCTLKINPVQCTSLTQPQTLVLGRWRTRQCFLEGAAAAALLRLVHQVPAPVAVPSPPRIIHRLCSSSRRLRLLQHLPRRVHSLLHKA